MAPWLLAPCALTGFSLRHGGGDVSSYGASPCGTVLCTYGAKALGAVHWVHFWNCSPQESICKNLTKKDQYAKILSFGPISGIVSPRSLYVKILQKRTKMQKF
jgi:hypothetical protein